MRFADEYKIAIGRMRGTRAYGREEALPVRDGGHYKTPKWERMSNERLKNECCPGIDCRKCEIKCAPGREKIKRMEQGTWIKA